MKNLFKQQKSIAYLQYLLCLLQILKKNQKYLRSSFQTTAKYWATLAHFFTIINANRPIIFIIGKFHRYKFYK